MKKILASVLAMIMLAGMGTAVLAGDSTCTKDDCSALHEGVEVTYVKTSDVAGGEESVSFNIDFGDIVMESYDLSIWHAEYREGATDENGDTEKEGATYENHLATIWPMSAEISDNGHDLMQGEWNVKFIVGDGESDNWYQQNKVPSFTDADYPNLVIFQGTDTDGKTYFIANYFTDEDEAALSSAWATFDSTIEDATYPGQTSGIKHFNKVYKINNGTSPEETFKFDFEFVSYKDADGKEYKANEEGCPTAPTITQASIKFDSLTANDTDAVPVSLNANDFPVVGVYTYEVTEVDNNIAGVTYATDPIYLVVTVLRGAANDDLDNTDDRAKYIAAIHYSDAINSSDKIGEVVNEYDAGTLAVEKQVEGALADTTEYFEVKVTFNAPEGETVKSAIYYTAAKDTNDNDKVKYNAEESVAIAAVADNAEGWATNSVTIYLKDDDTITFSNIPYGVTYTVKETVPNDYATEKYEYTGSVVVPVGGVDQTFVTDLGDGIDDTQGAAMGSNQDVVWTHSEGSLTLKDMECNTYHVTITNTKDAEIDTGISVDSIPYIAMLGVVALGGTGFIVSKKRRSED